ncbi:MAG: hypothetical protein ACC628_07400 [Pirellulaceae bacterium]
MKRRRFMIGAGAAAAAFAAAVTRLARRVRPASYVEALRTRLYLGPRRPLDDAEIRRPGRWGG